MLGCEALAQPTHWLSFKNAGLHAEALPGGPARLHYSTFSFVPRFIEGGCTEIFTYANCLINLTGK